MWIALVELIAMPEGATVSRSEHLGHENVGEQISVVFVIAVCFPQIQVRADCCHGIEEGAVRP